MNRKEVVMNPKANIRTVGVIGTWSFILATGISVPFVIAESHPSGFPNGEQKSQLTPNEEKEILPNTQPVVPPINDSEMVIQPNTPHDPDAVVIPPILDPEMAVDPATRQPMTEEKLERLTPEGFENNSPGEEQRDIQKN
jgi:hypothetical protein